MTEEQKKKLASIGQIYTPAYPIEIKELFSGRTKELITTLGIIWIFGAIVYHQIRIKEPT